MKNKFKTIFNNILTYEVFSYIFFGVLTTLIGLIVYKLYLNQGFGVVFANTISTFIAIMFAYTTNKIWVFKSLNFSIKILIREFLTFLSSRFVTFIIDTILLVVLVNLLLYDPLLSKLFTSIVVILLNYIASKKIVFR